MTRTFPRGEEGNFQLFGELWMLLSFKGLGLQVAIALPKTGKKENSLTCNANQDRK